MLAVRVVLLCVIISAAIQCICAEHSAGRLSEEKLEITTAINDNPEKQEDASKEQSNEELKNENLDYHTVVALIDIVFTDGTKRTCSGAIIHERVVITAAHCFILLKRRTTITLELTASFVVIGTKKLFDSGYEQYLPISKILIHPKHKGWIADLALVFTFASMESDKSGKAIPLSGNNIPEPLNSYLTVLSWGRCHLQDKTATSNYSPDPSFEDQEEGVLTTGQLSNENTKLSTRMAENRYLRQGVTQKHSRYLSKYTSESKQEGKKGQSRYRYGHKSYSRFEALEIPIYTIAGNQDDTKKNRLIKQIPQNFRFKSENEKFVQWSGRPKSIETIKTFDSTKNKNLSNVKLWLRVNERTRGHKIKVGRKHRQSHKKNRGIFSMNVHKTPEFSHFKGMRRSLNDEVHELTIGVFRYENVKTCMNMIEVTKPQHYNITDGNDVVCFTSDSRFITDEDSGAPVLRRGKLVAVTVGGVYCDGNHVAVGMKISCFCSWISANLPIGSITLDCCIDCCDIEKAARQQYKVSKPNRTHKKV